MGKIILQVSFLILLLILGLVSYKLYDSYFSNSIKTFDNKLDDENSKEQFKDFLYENQGNFVHLSITVLGTMKEELLKGIDKDNKITFTAPDQKNPQHMIKYVIKLFDDGRMDFSFDANSGKLEGIFRTYKREDSNGNTILNLVPVDPKWLKKS